MELKSSTIASLINEAGIDDSLRKQFNSFLSDVLQSSSLHLSLLDNALEMITAIDINKCILFWNKACEKDINIKLKDGVGKSIFEVFPATRTNGFDDLMNRVLAGEEINIKKRAYLHKNGYYEARMIPMRSKTGEIIGCINYMRDITDKILTEEKILKTATLLAETQQLAKIGVFEWILDSDELYWSDEIYKIFGLDANEVNVTPDLYLSYLYIDDEIAAAKNFYKNPTGYNLDEPVKFIRKIKRNDGSVAYIQGSASFVVGANDKPLRVTGFIQDISEKKQVEQNLLDLNEELKRSNQELEQFAYVASHDLKEPLRMISSYAQLLLRQIPQNDATATLYAGFVKDGVNNINRLIDDLLQYSRVGSREKEFVSTDCNTVVQEIKDFLAIKLDETDTTIHCENLPEIIGVKVLIKQLFQNLIENAIKFRSDKLPVIKISAVELPQFWKITVQDNGIGIAPEYSERIFKIFQRLHTRDQYPGSGIGLAVCRKIIDIHKGNIWVESVAGHGATFHFTLAK